MVLPRVQASPLAKYPNSPKRSNGSGPETVVARGWLPSAGLRFLVSQGGRLAAPPRPSPGRPAALEWRQQGRDHRQDQAEAEQPERLVSHQSPDPAAAGRHPDRTEPGTPGRALQVPEVDSHAMEPTDASPPVRSSHRETRSRASTAMPSAPRPHQQTDCRRVMLRSHPAYRPCHRVGPPRCQPHQTAKAPATVTHSARRSTPRRAIAANQLLGQDQMIARSEAADPLSTPAKAPVNDDSADHQRPIRGLTACQDLIAGASAVVAT